MKKIWLFLANTLAASLMISCSTNSSWEPWIGSWSAYNLQFVEGTKFIATFVRAYGRTRTNSGGFEGGHYEETDKQGLEYGFYEGDYSKDPPLRLITTYRTIEKVEIVADSSNLVLSEFSETNKANFIWINRQAGTTVKEIRNVDMGPYKLGEYQLRLYSHKVSVGSDYSVPSLEFDQALVTSVRFWKKPGEYIVDIGAQINIDPANGIWDDFTSPNKFSPSPFFTFRDSEKVANPVNTDTIFSPPGRHIDEIWKIQDSIFGAYVSNDKNLVLISTNSELDKIALKSLGLDSLDHSQIEYIDSRQAMEISMVRAPALEVQIKDDKFNGFVSRVDRAPDGLTAWTVGGTGGGQFVFSNSKNGKTIVYGPSN